MKMRLVPVVASLCGTLLCASSAEATTVYVHNKPMKNVASINRVTYVPFSELMNGLKLSWSVDEHGDVILKQVGRGGLEVVSENFNLYKGDTKIVVDGVKRNGVVWVPVRLARDLGYGFNYTAATDIVDIVSARLINDDDRKAAEEVSEARAAKEAKLAEEAAAAKAAFEERKQAMKELKDKKAKKAKEGSYDAGFEAEEAGEAAAKAVAAKQKDVGDVTTFGDLMEVQKNLDEQNAARLKAISDALLANSGKSAEKAAPTPAPRLIVKFPQAKPDLFSGHITMTATVQNIGSADAKGLTAKVSLLDPSGNVLMTKTLRQNSLETNGQWNIAEGFDHMSGSELPRGTYNFRVVVDCANKATDK